MRFIGLMSGTSADGIDAALVDIDPEGIPSLVLGRGYDHSPAIAARIEEAITAQDLEAQSLGELDQDLGHAFAQAANQLLADADIASASVDAIASHGQTVLHRPESGYSVQLGSGAVIAARTGITTINDFRAADLAHGGQGAPLAPAFHNAVLRSPTENRVVLNLGGIANITWLPSDNSGVFGFDTGPANTLSDLWCREHTGAGYDADGAWARSGRTDEKLYARFMDDAYFAAGFPKSTGREYFNRDWIDSAMSGERKISPQDIQATLVEVTAGSIAGAIQTHCEGVNRVLVCGGGIHNDYLLERLRSHLGQATPVDSTATTGIDPDWLEAMAFAWLGWCHLKQRPGNLPDVTGARKAVVLGARWPASGGD